MKIMGLLHMLPGVERLWMSAKAWACAPVGRRSFLKQTLFSALALTGYLTDIMAAGSVGTGVKKPSHVKEGIEIEGSGIISWAKPGSSDIRIKGSLPESFIQPRATGIPRGLVLCAVEANRQISYCRTLKKGMAIPEMKPHPDGYFRFAVRADIVRILGLPELETTYYVHASCGKYRTGVIAIRLEKGN